MKIKTTLAAALLALAPTYALAQEACGGGGHSEITMSCADGTVWDSKSETCVSKVTG